MSEDSSWRSKCGFTDLSRAVRKPEIVQQLLEQGHPATAEELFAAIDSTEYAINYQRKPIFRGSRTSESLILLLNAGADPNSRISWAATDFSTVDAGWATGSPSTPRKFVTVRREWYALYRTGIRQSISRDEKSHQRRMQMTLLDYGANPFAWFRQPLHIARPFYAYPGSDLSAIKDEEEAYGKHDMYDRMDTFSVPGTTPSTPRQQAQDEEFARQLAVGEASLPPLDSSDDTNDEDPDYFPAGSGPAHDKMLAEKYLNFTRFGLRGTIHAMLEDGLFVQGILEYPGLDLEHRDPQGRTLFLSACRSSLGLDKHLEGSMEDLTQEKPIVPHLGRGSADYWTELAKPTLYQFFVDKGANLLAVDNYGKNALINMLEAESRLPPESRASLRDLASKHPQLVNQPDIAGNYPIHAALRRLRLFYDLSATPKDSEQKLELWVNILLDAGANPTVLDQRGNNAIHYLVNDGLTQGPKSEARKRLLERFVKAGVDMNARNGDDKAPLEFLFFDDPRDPWVCEQRDTAFDGTLLDWFVTLGARLTTTNSRGEGLLHIAAKHLTQKAALIAAALMERGVDPDAEDADGQISAEVARNMGNDFVLQVLMGLLKVKPQAT